MSTKALTHLDLHRHLSVAARAAR